MVAAGAPGSGPHAGPWAICDRCGRKRRHASLRFEWSNLLVCNECLDPRPVHLTPPQVNPYEGGPIKNPRPVPEPYFVTDNEVTPESL